ncbi:hypothetical protein E3983_11140 [Legionella israelensis]|uniref:Uncharacterized protein n=1 Tax=Legionella israelensis TaxID=454 RepID=A0AAX1EIE0_9GAMM|nr:hypothetical protein [Legionella israelensis]QBR84857.1 hypothetical protein E3983_11140 [Legionella israelensis]
MRKNKIDKEGSDHEAKHYMVTYVKETKDGPGHVSVSVLKQKKTDSKVSHTSFFPGALGSLINGVTFGSVPVRGEMAPSHHEDLEEADRVLVKEIERDTYKKAKIAQKEFSREVENGQRFYSVFGHWNPIASTFSHLFSAFRADHMTKMDYTRRHGFSPVEDMCGFNLYDENEVKIDGIKTDNCSSSVRHVLNGAGMNIEHTLVPSLFTPKLQKRGFQEMDKSEFKTKFKV